MTSKKKSSDKSVKLNCQHSPNAKYSERQQMNIRLDYVSIDKLKDVLEFWSTNETECLTFLGFESMPESFRSNISLCRFILEAGIDALYSDVVNQRRIYDLALEIDGFLQTSDNTFYDEDAVKSFASAWARAEWGIQEHEMLFDLIYPLALNKSNEIGDEDPDEDNLVKRLRYLDGSINLR